MKQPVINKLLTPYNFTDKNSDARIKYIVIHYVGALGGADRKSTRLNSSHQD